VSAPSESIGTADAGVLVDRGVNVILSQPGRGIVVWSARTTSADRNWKYVNIRRLLIYLEASINRRLQWVVFEPDGTLLWETVAGAIQTFLLPIQRAAMIGTPPA